MVGPQNINDTFWPSLHDSVRNLLKSAPGGQLFALLLDYLRMHRGNIDRLGKMGLHIEMINCILVNIPKSSVGTRKLTETTADLPECDPFEGSMGRLRTILGPELLNCMRESALMFLITDLAKQQKTSDSDPALSFSPYRNSLALIAVGENKAHLFHLSLPLTVHYSPLNLLLRCLLMFLQRACEAESCLDIEEIVTNIDFSAFIRIIFNNCLNQGSVMTVVGLLSVGYSLHSFVYFFQYSNVIPFSPHIYQALMKDSQHRSRIVLETLTSTIFNQVEASPHTRILVDLAISILLELLSYQDSLWEYRMQFVFSRTFLFRG